MNRIEHEHERGGARPRVIAVGGGAGGVGRSTLVAELSRVWARKGRRVLVVDAHLANPTQYLRLGLDEPTDEPTFGEGVPLAAQLVGAEGAKPALLSLGHLVDAPLTRDKAAPGALFEQLSALDFETILIDLPPDPTPASIDWFVRSDVPIFVVATEAVSLVGATRYLRHALVAALRTRAAAETSDAFEAAIATLEFNAGPAAFQEAMAGEALTELLNDTLRRFEPYLVLKQTRESAERELGTVLAHTWWYLTGVRPRFLGAVDHDERRWFHMRQDDRSSPLGSDDGTGAHVEALTRQIDDIATLDATRPRMPRPEADGPLHMMGIADTCSNQEIRQAYRRLWEGFRRDSALTRTLLPKALRKTIVAELERSNLQLQTWLAERGSESGAVKPVGRTKTTDPGKVLREARDQAGLSQRELSLQTKIGLRYIEAIEKFEVDELPRPVYLRGYLREVARALDLDVDSLLDEYLTAVSNARSDRILTRD